MKTLKWYQKVDWLKAITWSVILPVLCISFWYGVYSLIIKLF